MSVIINIDTAYRTMPPASPSPDRLTTAPSPSRVVGRDRVEFSQFGASLARKASGSDVRIARALAIRSEIVKGTYETRERIDGTVDRLLDVIG